MKSFYLLIYLIFPAIVFSAAVTVYNDSAFPLNATILDATGQVKGKVTVMPQHQMKWQDSNQNISTFSETPFTVIFTCLDGTEYGVSTNVPQSSFVSANSSDGRHYCKPQQGKKPNNQNPSVGEQIDSDKQINPGQFQQTDMY